MRRAGKELKEAMRTPSTGPEVDSFYHLANVPMQHLYCRGLSCFAARERNPERWRLALAQSPPVHCLGKCYDSPSSTDDESEPNIETRCPQPIILQGVADRSALDLDSYRASGGYEALKAALRRPPKAIIDAVERSQLRGRGGAGYLAGLKWRAVEAQPIGEKYVVANADEGDHGSYIDRFLMERVPHRLLEAMLLAGYGVGARKGTIYLRKEYPDSLVALERALEEASQAGLLGRDVLGSGFGFEIEIFVGQGSYVCGEETSLLNSIEHRRPEVRARPPFPTERGLFGRPTLVNNVETLASVPWIVLHGADAYAAIGTSSSCGTKAVSLNSLFQRPGLYEVEFGVPLRWIFDELGGGLKSGSIKAAIVGGPLAGLIHPSEFDTPLDFDAMRAIGASVGHGGIVAFSQDTRMIDLLAHVFAFGAHESCGKCTPCRLGARALQRRFAHCASGGSLTPAEAEEARATLAALRATSLCGHGTGLGEFADSLIAKFGKELEPCFAS